jgi:putative Mn2+ efflux pump MntP
MTPWTKLASTIVLGISANTENLPVGFAYGLRGVPIGLARNLVIAIVTTVATLLPLTAGRGLRDYLPPEVPNIVAGSLLIGLGFFNIWIERRKTGGKPNDKNPFSRASGISPCGESSRLDSQNTFWKSLAAYPCSHICIFLSEGR